MAKDKCCSLNIYKSHHSGPESFSGVPRAWNRRQIFRVQVQAAVCFTHRGLLLPWEPHLQFSLRISVFGMMRSPVHPCDSERPLSVPTVTLLSLLRSCHPGLSAETHFLADFPLDWEKPVSCQDIWGGTENTLYFPDVILSACLSHMELGEGCALVLDRF